MLQQTVQIDAYAGQSIDRIDQVLLSDIAERRDTKALEQLYNRYRPRLTGFLRRMTRDDSLIEEAYNDIMLKVWDKAGQYQSRSKASSWIFSIAYRVCLRMIKKQNFRGRVLELFGQERDPSDLVESGNGVADEELVSFALEKLSAEHRLVIELSYFMGYSTEEIGRIANCPTNTVKTRLFHARKKLKVHVEHQSQ